MTDDARALFRELADRTPAEREDYYVLHQVPSELRAEVESLLLFDGAAGESLNAYVAAAGDAILDTDLPPAGRRYGSYRLIRLLGCGGMGAVYEAEQEHPRRIVALKVIKAGLASAELVRRFRLESEALGRLQHPGIAQVHEAGTAETPFGPQPYFAMEFVHGQPLLQYAESHGLGPADRLKLIVRICEAVHHAHQRGIVHRDLKPDNILVDETGQPKILDFGVARVTGGDVAMTNHTFAGQLVGTLAYMSPEQVSADPLDVDTRSDVYSIGVILYELLAKRLPYDTSGRLHEVVRAIREDDPPALGTVDRAYRGDVETIAAKALEKEKADRYGSATALSDDITRFLHDEPIVARRPSTAYQLRKFARRNRAVVAGAAAVFVVLLAGIVASTWQAARAMRAERVAAAEAATAKAISDFLQNDLLAQASAAGQAKPGTKVDPDIKVRTALDRAAETISGKFQQQPDIEASIRTTIGQTYKQLGLYPEAQRQFGRVVELRRAALGESNTATISAMGNLAALYITQGRYKDAEPLARAVADAQRRALGEDHPETLASTFVLADLYRMQRNPAAEPLLLRLIDAQRRVKGPDHPDTLDTQHLLAVVYRLTGRYAQAEPLLEHVLATRRRVEGDDHPDTLDTINDLAVLYDSEGKYAKGAPLVLGLLEAERRVLGPEHDKTSNAMYQLAILNLREGHYAEAEPLFEQARALKRRNLGEESAPTLTITGNFGVLYTEQGRYAEAESLQRGVLAARQRVLGNEHPDTLSTLNNIAQIYRGRGDYPAAAALLQQVLAARKRVQGPQHYNTLASTNDLAQLSFLQGKDQEAAAGFTDALAGRRRVLGDDHPDTLVSLIGLVETYLHQGRLADADPLSAEALERYERTRPDNWRRYRAESLRGEVLEGERRLTEAEPLLLDGYRGMVDRASTIPAFDRMVVDQAAGRIARLYKDLGQPEKAVAVVKRTAAAPR